MSRRTMLQGLADAQQAPTLAARTGFEISLEDHTDELPWLLYQRVLCGEVHFITGHSGAGKSTVVTDMAVHYLTGRAWLDADIERASGHVLWIAAEDDYGTERRVRHLFKQEPNAKDLAARFHLIRGINEPMAFEQQCVAQTQAMAAMGMRVDMIVLDTWGASGLCFADNDTEAVLKAMFILKNVGKRTAAAVLVTDHLPLGNEEAWQKGNGAKTGNSGFVYRVTSNKRDMVSIDCGKARLAHRRLKVLWGRSLSENYGKDIKGRTTTVNVFKRDILPSQAEHEQSAVLRLGAMLPGVVAAGMDALRAGAIVKFESVATEIGHAIKGEVPGYVVTKDDAFKLFAKDGMTGLLNSGHFRTMHSLPYLAVFAPSGSSQASLVVSWPLEKPSAKEGSFPWH